MIVQNAIVLKKNAPAGVRKVKNAPAIVVKTALVKIANAVKKDF